MRLRWQVWLQSLYKRAWPRSVRRSTLTDHQRQGGASQRQQSSIQSLDAATSTTSVKAASADASDAVYVTLDYLIAQNHPVPVTPGRRQQLVHQGSIGARSSAHLGQGIEFAGLRLYAADDDARHIDWRASARHRVPLLRQFSEDRERRMSLLVDQRSSMFFGSGAEFKSVRAARLTAQLAWRSMRQGQWIGAVLMGEAVSCVRAGRSRAHVLTLLQQLAALNQSLHAGSEPGTALETAIRRCSETVQGGTEIVILSDFADLDQSCCNRLLLLQKRCHVNLVVIEDVLETRLPIRGRLGIADATFMRVIRVDREVAKHYQRMRAVRHGLIESLRAAGITVSNDAPGSPHEVEHQSNVINAGQRLPASGARRYQQAGRPA